MEKKTEFQNLFETFETKGKLYTLQDTKAFADIPWSKHPTFEGVELKHIITGTQTNGAFSYHLVRIAPDKQIGLHVHKEQLETHEVIAGNGTCINNGQPISYEPGMIAILPKNIPHEVTAGENGLYLFAKFMPALN